MIDPENRPVTSAGGPYAGQEAAAIHFDASGSYDLDTDDALLYRWDFDGDGTWDTARSPDPRATHTWNDDHTGTAMVEAFDGKTAATASAPVTVVNVAPSVSAAPVAGEEGTTVSLSGSFDDSSPVDTHTATIDWGDGSAVGGGAVVDSGGDGTVSGTHVYADNGTYTVTLCVTDDDLGRTCTEAKASIANVAADVNRQSAPIGEEAAAVPFNATFTDPSPVDTHTATIDWGDGTSVEAGVVVESGGQATVSGSHAYADNGTYTVGLCVTDDDGGTTCRQSTASIKNVAPAVDTPSEPMGDEGSTVSTSVAFSDVAAADTHTATIDWGDGTGIAGGTVAEGGGDGAVSGAHEYADDGTYTVTICVADDDAGTTCRQTEATIRNVVPAVSITSVTKPNPYFVLPVVHTITFAGSFTDPGWSDSHTSSWLLEPTVTLAGMFKEENGKPDSTGISTVSHAFSTPGGYKVILTVGDDDGASSTADVTINVVSPTTAVGTLNSWMQGLPSSAFKGQADQRKKALSNKLNEVIAKINAGENGDAARKLINDIRRICDGSVKGASSDDWIADPRAQAACVQMIDDIVRYLKL